MTNKIVILQNSVELYEHYINDQKWERTLSFPRGGLTYLISNGTIKFYAFEDYFYRNCLMSMQLPIDIINEDEHIDGEYDDVDEITDILDEIFPVNDIEIELKEYLKIRDAEELYQPIGDYVTTDELDEVLEDYYTKDEVDDLLDDKADKDDVYTKDEADARFQPIGDYVSADTFTAYTAETAERMNTFFDDAEYDSSAKTINFYNSGNLVDSIDARPFIKDGMVDSVSLIELSGDTYLHIVFNTDSGKEPIDLNIGDLFNADNYYTKDEADEKFQPVGDYATSDELDDKADKDDVYTKPEVDDLLYYKLDVSAYTPFDPSNYYTKIEVDNKISSGGTFDPTQYYNKSQSDTRFALKSEIPSLSGYATQEWVLNKHYVTESTVQQYITNLQQQINSIIESISGCCSQTGETLYRWITLTGENDFICSGTTKCEKQQKQQSTDNGMTWTNVSPAVYQRGAVLETDSPDCGYAPDPQYRWKAAPTDDYLCIGVDKYYKVYYEVSYDGGQTWQHVVPEQTKRGDLIEANSTDCGYIAPQYRWYTSQSEYICSGTTKYEKQYYQVSTDGGTTWNNVSPLQTRTGAVIEYNSVDCGYTSFKFKGVLHNGSTVNRSCNSSSILSKEEVSTTNGYVSIEIGGCVTSIAEKAFLNEPWLTGVTIPSNVKSVGRMAFANTGMSALTLSEGVETLGDGAFKANNNLRTVIIPNSVKQLVGDTFYVNKIKTLVIGSGVTSIGAMCFQRASLTGSTVTVLATTPPTIVNNSPIFDGWSDAPIYVPAASLNAYKTASGWNQYASQIRAINS